MACLTASSGRFSPSRMPLLGFSPEPDVKITSRQCCPSCTGFQSRDELTLSWRVSSSRPCLVGHLLTWPTTYIHLVAEGPRRRLRSSTDRSCAVPRTRNTFGDRSFSVAGPRVWNSLPAHLRDEEISYNSFRRELKTYWFRGDRGAM